ncbi:HAD family hydrolase [Paenibacillus tarimensis]
MFLDFYGTVVHEDDDIIPQICREIQAASSMDCSIQEIGSHWWKGVSHSFRNSYGEAFENQRTIGLKSLQETIGHFESAAVAGELISIQFDHWRNPGIFEDAVSFLSENRLPVYIVSNIDTDDVLQAIAFHGIHVDGVITSEDARSYKPRPEIFREALGRFDLSAKDVIHVGDSYMSDVEGAAGAGIQTVWMNRKNRPLPESIFKPDYIVRDFDELFKLILNKG